MFLPHSFPSQTARKQFLFQQTASNEDISNICQPEDHMEGLAHEQPCQTRTGPDGNPGIMPSSWSFAQETSFPLVLSWSLLLVHLY